MEMKLKKYSNVLNVPKRFKNSNILWKINTI